MIFNKVSLRIKKGELNKIHTLLDKEVYTALLMEMDKDIRQDIRDLAMPYSGVSKDGITSPKSVSSVIKGMVNKKLRVSPTIDHFEINKQGYLEPIYVDVTSEPDLYEWVQAKYIYNDKQEILSGQKDLHIRAKNEKGKFPPLGDKKRDFFGIAFNMILTNKNKYGLR